MTSFITTPNPRNAPFSLILHPTTAIIFNKCAVVLNMIYTIVLLRQGFWAHGNMLGSLPQDFGKLTNLQTISLAGNKLTSLPKSISGLVSLRDLGLQGNELSEVPAEIGALSESYTLQCTLVADLLILEWLCSITIYWIPLCLRALLSYAMPALKQPMSCYALHRYMQCLAI